MQFLNNCRLEGISKILIIFSLESILLIFTSNLLKSHLPWNLIVWIRWFIFPNTPLYIYLAYRMYPKTLALWLVVDIIYSATCNLHSVTLTVIALKSQGYRTEMNLDECYYWICKLRQRDNDWSYFNRTLNNN